MTRNAVAAISTHWPEYLMEALALGIFMLSACVFDVLLEHPASRFHLAIENAVVRRGLMGVAMGATAVAIILSPWGKRSGAHMNPSVTLAFASLGKIAAWDAAFYIAAQFFGGLAGTQLAHLLLGARLENAAVNFVVTVPGMGGWEVAFWAEALISAILMLAVLAVSNSAWSRWTPYCAGALVAAYVLVEAPLSGMSMNPARTLGSGFAAHYYPALWIYFVAPPAGMLAAAQVFNAARRVYCAKLHHDNPAPCLFRCAYREKRQA